MVYIQPVCVESLVVTLGHSSLHEMVGSLGDDHGVGVALVAGGPLIGDHSRCPAPAEPQ